MFNRYGPIMRKALLLMLQAVGADVSSGLTKGLADCKRMDVNEINKRLNAVVSPSSVAVHQISVFNHIDLVKATPADKYYSVNACDADTHEDILNVSN